MKTVVSAVALAAIAFTGCQNDYSQENAVKGDDLILRAHFIGSERLLKDDNAPQLTAVWKLKSSAELRNRALDRFAGLPFLWLSNALPKDASPQSALLRPLLEDALSNESFVEWRSSAFTLAAKVSDARARDWDTNLRRAVVNWNLGNPTTLERAGTSAWELRKTGVTAIRFTRADGWVSVTVGPSAGNGESNALTKLKQLTAKPSGAWLEGDANLAQWKGRLSVLDGFSNLPAAHFSFSNRADFVRTFVQLDFPKAHQWKTEPWIIPTNIIWDPLMDFTVARGISRVLDEWPFFHNLGWKPTPSQFCGWGVRDLPFQLNYAFPARNVSGHLKNIEKNLGKEIAKIGGPGFQVTLVPETNYSSLSWVGLPLAVPTISPVVSNNIEFALINFFPLTHLRDQPPKELFEQINRNDLVVYDWESTQYRMITWRQVYQLGEIATHRSLSPTNALDQRWQTDVMPLVRDCITEAHVSSPNQMTLVRKSSTGLSSFELVTLSRWIESTDFPAFGVYPPRAERHAVPKVPARR